MTYGITTTGFSKKTLTVILDEIAAEQKGLLGSNLNTLATSVFGQQNGVVGDKIRELWDLGEAIYRALYPDSASGEALDQVGAITGAERLPAKQSSVTLDRLVLSNGTTVPSGSLVSVGASGAQFKTTAAISNSSGFTNLFSAPAVSVDYGPILGNAKSLNVIQSPVVGWLGVASTKSSLSEPFSASLSGKTLTFKIDGGSVQTVTFPAHIGTWSAADVALEIDGQGTGVAAYDAAGFVLVVSKTEDETSKIEITGGSGNVYLGLSTDEFAGFNSLDADLGNLEETDEAFRIRREELLRAIGKSVLEAIVATVRDVDGVIQVYGFENIEIATDPVSGLPGKSFEIVVLGGDEQTIAETIWESKPAGIKSYGSISKTVADSKGYPHVISFSRPTEVPIYISLEVSVNSGIFPVDGDDQIKAALVALGDSLQIGEDVIAIQFRCSILTVAGVVDVPTFKIDTINPPVNVGNITIGFRDLAKFDTSRISVTVL